MLEGVPQFYASGSTREHGSILRVFGVTHAIPRSICYFLSHFQIFTGGGVALTFRLAKIWDPKKNTPLELRQTRQSEGRRGADALAVQGHEAGGVNRVVDEGGPGVAHIFVDPTGPDLTTDQHSQRRAQGWPLATMAQNIHVTWVHGSQVQRFPTKELRDETESHVRRASGLEKGRAESWHLLPEELMLPLPPA